MLVQPGQQVQLDEAQPLVLVLVLVQRPWGQRWHRHNRHQQ
jgi:hypothetical protein